MDTGFPVETVAGRVVAVEVGGVRYARAEDVPDPADRAQVEALLAGTSVPRVPVEKVVFVVFAGVAVLLLGIAAATGVSTARAVAREQAAPGRVVGMTPRTVPETVDADNPARQRTIDREYFFPVVEFALPDGTGKTVQTPEGSWPPAHEVGESVTVRYDPGHPTSARIESGAGGVLMWVWTIVTGILGLAFGGATVLIHQVFIRPAQARLQTVLESR